MSETISGMEAATIEGRLDVASVVRGGAYLGSERRRPGRQADVSPALIPLMRKPTSASARVRVALYDAPGFMIPQAASPRRREPGFVLRAGGLAAGLAVVCGAAVQTMCWAWG